MSAGAGPAPIVNLTINNYFGPVAATGPVAGSASAAPAVAATSPPADVQRLPFPGHLKLIPKSSKGRAIGKYRSKGGKVIYYNGKRLQSACWGHDCHKQPAFGNVGEAPTACKKCRTVTMIDVRNKHCPCGKQMTFGMPGERATACDKCRVTGMVDVANNLCPCGAQMKFGLPGERPAACGKCKTPDMIDVVSKRCECGTQMTFGMPGERPTACDKCRVTGMVDVVNNLCPCGAQMKFGLPGERPAACGKCKTPDMIDVVSKRCECGTKMSFGLPGARPVACVKCKTPDMVDVINNFCPCGTQMSFGLPGERPVACDKCKTPDMINVVSKRCACGDLAWYDDADGNKRTLCLDCAVAEGTHPKRVQGASYEACRFFCLLARMTMKRESIPHVHWDRVSGEWNDFKEVEGLVKGRSVRPDGFLPDPSGESKGTVYLYHGNRFHGYPPEHANHLGDQVFRSARTGHTTILSNRDLYDKTEATTLEYRAAGYATVEIWGHAFAEAEKSNGLLLGSLIRRGPLSA